MRVLSLLLGLSSLIFFFFFFLMIRRPPRSTLFPTRRSSDLTNVPPGLTNVVSVAAGQSYSMALTTFVRDRKSTRLNSSHLVISYAVFCLKKKNDTGADQHEESIPDHHHLLYGQRTEDLLP